MMGMAMVAPGGTVGREELQIRIDRLLRRERGERLFSGTARGSDRVLVLQLASTPGRPDEKELERLRGVGEALSAIDNPAIPRQRGWFIKDSGVIEMITVDPSGVFLADLLTSGMLSPGRVLSFWEQLLTALGPLAEKRLPYCLSHPDRIMLDRRGRVVLPEAGFVSVVEPLLVRGPSQSGSLLQRLFVEPDLVPPELLRGQPCTPASDVYQSAALVYRLMCGESAFGSGMSLEVYNRMLSDQSIPLDERLPEVSTPLAELVSDCLSKDQSRRPRTPVELKGRLLTVRGSREPLAELILKQPEKQYSARYGGILAVHSGGDEAEEELSAPPEPEVAEVEKQVLLGQLERMREKRGAKDPGKSRMPLLIALLVAVAAAVFLIGRLPDMSGPGERKAEGPAPPDSDGMTHHEVVWDGENAGHPSERSLFEGIPAHLKRGLEARGIPLSAELKFEPPVLPPYKVRCLVDGKEAASFRFTARNRLATVGLPPSPNPDDVQRYVVLYDADGLARMLVGEDATGRIVGEFPL